MSLSPGICGSLLNCRYWLMGRVSHVHHHVAVGLGVGHDCPVHPGETGVVGVLEVPHGSHHRKVGEIRVRRVDGLGEQVRHPRAADLVGPVHPVGVGVEVCYPGEAVQDGLLPPPPGVRDVVVGDYDAFPLELRQVATAQVAYPDYVLLGGVYGLHRLLGDLLLEPDGVLLAEPLGGDVGDRPGGDAVGVYVRNYQYAPGAPQRPGGGVQVPLEPAEVTSGSRHAPSPVSRRRCRRSSPGSPCPRGCTPSVCPVRRGRRASPTSSTGARRRPRLRPRSPRTS